MKRLFFILAIFFAGQVVYGQPLPHPEKDAQFEKDFQVVYDVAKKYDSWSKISQFDKLKEIFELLDKGELYFVNTKKGGMLYQGWVDKDGKPCGLFSVYKEGENNTKVISAYYHGVPFGFGMARVASSETVLYGEFAIRGKAGDGHTVFERVKVNGDGSIFWPSGSHYWGQMKDNVQEGFGVVSFADYYSGEVIDWRKTGLHKNGVLQTEIGELAERALGTNKSYSWSGRGYAFKEEIEHPEGTMVYFVNASEGIERLVTNTASPISYDLAMSVQRKGAREMTYSFIKPIMGRAPNVGPMYSINISRLMYGYFDPSNGDYLYDCYMYYDGDVSYELPGKKRIWYLNTGDIYDLSLIKALFSPYENKDFYNFGVHYCTDGNIYIGSFDAERERSGKGVLLTDSGIVIQQGVWRSNQLSSYGNVLDEVKARVDFESVLEKNKTIRGQKNSVQLSPSFVLKF